MTGQVFLDRRTSLLMRDVDALIQEIKAAGAGRGAEAALAYEAAIARTENAAERDFLERSRQALTRA